MNRSELTHIRESLTGVRSMLSSFLYCSVGIPLLRRAFDEAKSDLSVTHEIGGVMDHLANIIDTLDQAIGNNEPGDRETFVPRIGTADEVHADCCEACGNYLAPNTSCRCEGTGNG